MKKLYKLGLVSVLALSLAACGAASDEPAEEPEVGLEEGIDGEEGLLDDESVPASGDVDEDADDADADAEDADADAELEADDEAEDEDAAADSDSEEEEE